MAGIDLPELKGPAKILPMRRAVEYVRMPTDHQKYSTENQSEAIRKYGAERGFELVRPVQPSRTACWTAGRF